MIDPVIDLVIILNRIVDFAFGNILQTLTVFSYWISLGLISSLIGLFYVPIFYFFMKRQTIHRIRDAITANFLSIRIFSDNPRAILCAQGRIFINSIWLLWYMLPSFIVMMFPLLFLLAQMSGWYQFRPLKIGETALVTVKTQPSIDVTKFYIQLVVPDSVDLLSGPVHVIPQNEIIWKLIARKTSSYPLYFQIENQKIEKKISIGNQNLPVSIKIPQRTLLDVILYPFEQPFKKEFPIVSIRLEYGDPIKDPIERYDWLLIFSVVSICVFLIFKRLFHIFDAL